MERLVGWFDSFEPYIRLPIGALQINLLLDSGFNGDLWLPAETLERLGWLQVSTAPCTLADGVNVERPIHRGAVTLFGVRYPVDVMQGGDTVALIGMHLLRHTRIELRPSAGTVVIEPNRD